jgi:probable addiction module antidote protein
MRVDPARLKAIAEDLTEVLASDDPSLLAAALGKLARERGMREVAAAAGLSREALYKALRPNTQPRFATISRVCGALGLKLVAKPDSA